MEPTLQNLAEIRQDIVETIGQVETLGGKSDRLQKTLSTLDGLVGEISEIDKRIEKADPNKIEGKNENICLHKERDADLGTLQSLIDKVFEVEETVRMEAYQNRETTFNKLDDRVKKYDTEAIGYLAKAYTALDQGFHARLELGTLLNNTRRVWKSINGADKGLSEEIRTPQFPWGPAEPLTDFWDYFDKMFGRFIKTLHVKNLPRSDAELYDWFSQ